MHRTAYLTWRLIAAAMLASATFAAHAEDWQFSVTPYIWLPNIEGDGTAAPPPGGGAPAFEVGPVDYLDNLDFVLMLAAEARRGRWSLRSDVIYIDFSNQHSAVKTVSGPGGAVEFPVNAGTTSALTGIEAQATIGYWLVELPKRSVEIFGGLRYLEISFDLDWEFEAPLDLLPQSGRIEQGAAPVDVIVGTNARYGLGDGKWFVPLRADIGTGDSAFTWQLTTGAGYSFSWGDLLLVYRQLEYQQDDGELLERLALSGPALGASFRF
jgi:hypothetical protein